MTKLILIRHGFSETNKKRILAGHLDAPLDEQGIVQAEMTAKFVNENYNVDVIYSSDLKRAKSTAEKISELTGKEIKLSKNLREIFAGDWEGKNWADLPKLYPEEFGLWLNDIGKSQCPNGENLKDLYARINGEIDKILSENQDKTIVVVTHATVIRVFMVRVLGLKVEDAQQVEWVPNASVSVYNIEGEKIIPELVGENSFHGKLGTFIPNVV